jgi:hypothetical protein
MGFGGLDNRFLNRRPQVRSLQGVLLVLPATAMMPISSLQLAHYDSEGHALCQPSEGLAQSANNLLSCITYIDIGVGHSG